MPPSHWRKGAVIGGVIGAAFGAFAYGVASHTSDTHPSIGVLPAAMLGGAVLFGLVGALIGSFSSSGP